jgi:hypothetical protein
MSFESDDRSYYAARARREQALAEAASNPRVASIHRQLALEYERRAGTTREVGAAIPIEHMERLTSSA